MYDSNLYYSIYNCLHVTRKKNFKDREIKRLKSQNEIKNYILNLLSKDSNDKSVN